MCFVLQLLMKTPGAKLLMNNIRIIAGPREPPLSGLNDKPYPILWLERLWLKSCDDLAQTQGEGVD